MLNGEHIGYLTLNRTGAWLAAPVQGRDVIAASAARVGAAGTAGRPVPPRTTVLIRRRGSGATTHTVEPRR